MTAPSVLLIGAREIIEWHDADASRRRIDQELDATIDRLAEAFDPGRLGPGGRGVRKA